MRLTHLAIVLVLCGLGCRTAERSRPGDAPALALSRGDRVVVELEAGAFVEGTVMGIDGERAAVQTTVAGEVLEVGVGDLLAIAAAYDGGGPGAYAVCGLGGARWVGCQVSEADGGPRQALLEDGARRELLSVTVLEAGALTRLNIERRFARTAARAEFRRAVQAAGTPLSTPSWKPRPGERILARRGEGWFSGRVHELERETVYVRFPGEQRPVPMSGADTRPSPPQAIALLVGPGAYVLARPAGEARPWEAVQVVALGEDESATVVDERGERSHRSLRDLAPLGPTPVGSRAAVAE